MIGDDLGNFPESALGFFIKNITVPV